MIRQRLETNKSLRELLSQNQVHIGDVVCTSDGKKFIVKSLNEEEVKLTPETPDLLNGYTNEITIAVSDSLSLQEQIDAATSYYDQSPETNQSNETQNYSNGEVDQGSDYNQFNNNATNNQNNINDNNTQYNNDSLNSNNNNAFNIENDVNNNINQNNSQLYTSDNSNNSNNNIVETVNSSYRDSGMIPAQGGINVCKTIDWSGNEKIGELISQYNTSDFPLKINVDSYYFIIVQSQNPTAITVAINENNTVNLPYQQDNTKDDIIGKYLLDQTARNSSQNNITNSNSNHENVLNSENNIINYEFSDNTNNNNNNSVLNNSFNNLGSYEGQRYNQLNYDYANINILNEHIKNHVNSLASQIVTQIKLKQNLSKYIEVPTYTHKTLKYKVNIIRKDQGVKVEVTGPCVDPGHTRYANIVNTLCQKQLKDLFKDRLDYSIADTVGFNLDCVQNDLEFQQIEDIIKGLESDTQVTVFDDPEVEVIKCINTERIIKRLPEGELKSTLQLLNDESYTQMIVWTKSNGFVRFDLFGGQAGKIDLYDVMGYDIERLKPVEPQIQPVDTQENAYTTTTETVTTTPQVEYRQVINPYVHPATAETTYTTTYTTLVNAAPETNTSPVIASAHPPVIKKIVANTSSTVENMQPQMVKLNNGSPNKKMTRVKVGKEQTTKKPVAVGTRVMKKNYKMPQQQVKEARMNIKPPRGIPDVSLKKEESKKIDITVGEPKKKKKVGKKIQKLRTPKKHIHDIYNIRTVKNGQSVAPIEKQAVAPVAAGAPQTVVQAPVPAPAPAEKQRPINIFMAPEKKAEQAHNIQDNISVNPKSQNIQDKININFNHERLLDDIKALLTKQGKNDVGQIIDIVDHIKFDQKVPPEYIKLVENLQVKLHELGEKVPGDVVIDNDVVLKEIETLREQIGNIKIPEFKSDNINVELNHLAEVNEKLKLIEDTLQELKKPTENNVNDNISVSFNGYDEFAKLISELRVDVQNLKEKNADIIVESPGIQEITDKLTVLIEDKLKNIKINDNINIEQPNIVIDQPDLTGILDEMKKMMVNVEDNIKVQIEQKLKEQQIKIDIPDNNVNITDNTTVQNEPPAPIVIDGLQELKNEIKNEIRNEINIPERHEPEIVIDQPEEKQINVNDNIEVNQRAQIPETTKEYINQVLQNVILQGQQSKNNDMLNVIQELKAEIQALKNQDFVIDLPEEQKINVNDNIEVNQRAPEKEQKEEIIENIYEEVDKSAKKEDNKTVITNEYEEKSDPKKKETTIINEYEARHEPVIGMPPMPMRGFMAQPMMPMMMPLVFMPPPMPMPVPAQQPQQPIIITQNQSDEEEEHDFWSTFWKVFLVLLLLASIIGLGFLLWKNAQKTTEQKPETKPEPKPQPEPEPVKQEEVHITPKESVTPGPIETNEGKTVLPVCEDGTTLQLNVDADKVNLGGDVGQITQTTKDAINLENAGVHNKLISSSGKVIDTRRIEINGNEIAARDWNGKLSEATIYRGTIQNGKAVINGETYTIANANGKAYSDGAVDLASQTSYGRNGNGTLSTDFGTLKQDLQINKNNTFTLNTTTEKGTVIASNTIDDVSNNATMQNMLKDKLNDSSLTKGEYNRIMDALDDGKLNDSYLQKVNNSVTGYSLDNSNNLGNSAGY